MREIYPTRKRSETKKRNIGLYKLRIMSRELWGLGVEGVNEFYC